MDFGIIDIMKDVISIQDLSQAEQARIKNASTDDIQDFLNEFCILREDLFMPASMLRDAMRGNLKYKKSQKSIAKFMRSLGHEYKRRLYMGKQTRCVQGLRLKYQIELPGRERENYWPGENDTINENIQ